MSGQRPYATLLAKGEDRRQRILDVAPRLLTRNGGRGTTLGQLERVTGRFRRAPDLIGIFSVLQMENLDSRAPLHGRFLRRYGMETSWLLDPSIPLTGVFRESNSSLARRLTPPSGTS